MADWLLVFLIAFVALLFFVVGLSLTQIFKGHPLQSEISTNPNMQRLGIKCAVQESREDLSGEENCAEGVGCTGNCAGCEIEKAK